MRQQKILVGVCTETNPKGPEIHARTQNSKCVIRPESKDTKAMKIFKKQNRVKKSQHISLVIFQHNHPLCRDIYLAWVLVFVFRYHRTSPPALVTS